MRHAACHGVFRRRSRIKGAGVGILLLGAIMVTVYVLRQRDEDWIVGKGGREGVRIKRASFREPTEYADDCDEHKPFGPPNISASQFPQDLFSLEARQHGAVFLHFLGLVYMFVALAIVCDEFFVPSLGVLTEKLEISDDVAGATFMAAGGSAPEFFTSMFGVFVAQDNVGIGTIVGSATFNILCVLAFCTLFSREVLHLTWWPLFRDMTFYIFALFLLVIFFSDEKITWHEALTMLLVYMLYGIFMKYNEFLESSVKSRLFRLPTIQEQPPELVRASSIRSESTERRKSLPIHGGTQLRNGLVHIAMSSDDEISNEEHHHHHHHTGTRIVEVKPKDQLSVRNHHQNDDNRPVATISGTLNHHESNGHSGGLPPVESTKTNGLTIETSSRGSEQRPSTPSSTDRPAQHNHHMERAISVASSNDESPMDLSWPESHWRRLLYIVLAPITIPLYFTLPDTRNPKRRRFFIVTFFGSILWIALFSYLMVWWANVIGETLGVPTEIMGLTILAAGTSIPDLITSVIVARKGLGDMAVSSSIGSNLFDICIGLPVPWLLFFGIQMIKSPSSSLPTISVISNGLICSVGMLFMMLVVLVVGIALSRWQMDKFFGLIMIISYIIFCIFSILLETGQINCPLRTPAEC